MDIQNEKIALFVGSDITAHLVLNKVVPEIIQAGYEPLLFFPKHNSSAKANQPELKEAAFLERDLVNKVVYPYLDAHPFPGEAKNLSPKGLSSKFPSYPFNFEYIDNVNDKSFVDRIKNDKSIIGGFSVRCFQIFKDDIIDAFKDRQFFLNLHPGILPKYRGVLSTVRAMEAGEKEYGWTLHNIDKGIDTGEILWMTARKLDLSKTGMLAQVDVASIGAESIKRALDEIGRGNILKGYPQDVSKKNYFSYPSREELDEWKAKKIKLADPEEAKNLLVDKFSDASLRHGRLLGAEITRAIESWKEQQATVPEAPSSTIKADQGNMHPIKRSARRKPSLPEAELNYGT